MSERCSLEAQLRHQAFHDPLTGLANRALFQDRVSTRCRAAADSETHVGVVFVDLDNFKTVNDSLGHSSGDLLLRSAAPARALSSRRSTRPPGSAATSSPSSSTTAELAKK